MPIDGVILEITESGLLDELVHTLDVLTRLRVKGIHLSIDDFGTGYAMMEQLANIPATELKIDRLFISNILVNSSDRILVQKTIEIGHELGMKVIAEGVETELQLNFLRGEGCDSVQDISSPDHCRQPKWCSGLMNIGRGSVQKAENVLGGGSRPQSE
jgi:EAL domain-containing protein (putative c-di-GMP-specific phosphodiesterase class I)